MARAARWGCCGFTISIWGRGRAAIREFRRAGGPFPQARCGIRAKNARDYATKADAFLLGPKSATALDYTRSQGNLVRFDPATNEFGVLSAAGEVRTYFRPVPGVTHKRSTNLEYFNVSCLMRF